MSTPRPAMLVAIVTAPTRPAWAIVSPSRSACSGFALRTTCSIPWRVSSPESISETSNAVAGRDNHVVGAARVPVVAVGVLLGGVLGVEPLASEGLLGGLRVALVAERVARVGPRLQADHAALPRRHRALVLVEDLHVPAPHGLAHRTLANLHERVVPAQRVGLGEPVIVEHGDAILLAKPSDRLRVERLARGAHDPELLRV